MSATVGKCPSCGAEITFRIGASRVAACQYCSALIARAGQNLQEVGKVSEVADTNSPIALGATGLLEGQRFEVIGRLQLSWDRATWDEWYVALADGRWAWLAEAQGRFYATFRVSPRQLPDGSTVSVGDKVFLEGHGRFVVTDVKEAMVATVRGELPSEVSPGATVRSCDLEGPRGAFGTIDYGESGDEPQLFLGRQVPFEALNLRADVTQPDRTAVRRTQDKLACANCNAPLTCSLGELAATMVCASCGAQLDMEREPMGVIRVLEIERRRPAVPIGADVDFDGLRSKVVGWMRRACVVEGTTYSWQEHLLYDPKGHGFRWLVLQNGHWSLATPISAGDVVEAGDVTFEGQRFRHFQATPRASVEEVLGEFYWQVREGDAAELQDYVAPPLGISVERTRAEVSYSKVRYLPSEEVLAGLRPAVRTLPEQEGVHSLQPYPHEEAVGRIINTSVIAAFAALALMVVFVVRSEPVDRINVGLSSMNLQPPVIGSGDAPEAGVHVGTFLSTPFQMEGGRAVEASFHADLNQAWAFLNAALVNDETGEVSTFDMEASYYSGVEGGESWSEGNTSPTTSFSGVTPGRYVLRADVQWDPKLQMPPTMTVRIAEGGWSFWQFLLVLVGLSPVVLFALHRAGFETSRWAESDHAPSSSEDD